MSALLSVQGLSVELPSRGRGNLVLRDVDFDIQAGEILGLVGESGSGKTMLALSILGLLPGSRARVSGRIELGGDSLLTLSGRQMERVRGRRVGMVFQEPMSALNPVLTVGFQIAECVSAHRGMDHRETWLEASRLLDLVAMPAATRRLREYPHQLSGGQRQRVMIAIALAGAPELLIADEPTTALDVTVQAQILSLLEDLNRELNLSILLITHDLAVVAECCHKVAVLYAGQVVERSTVQELFRSPGHPYSRALLALHQETGRRLCAGQEPRLPGRVPDPGHLPGGCSFHPRCSEALPCCDSQEPEEVAIAEDRYARCFLHDDIQEESANN